MANNIDDYYAIHVSITEMRHGKQTRVQMVYEEFEPDAQEPESDIEGDHVTDAFSCRSPETFWEAVECKCGAPLALTILHK